MYVHVLVCQTSPVPMLLLHADAHDTYIRGMSELCLIIGLQDKWRLIQLDSFFCKRPFFANKKKFCESFANHTLIFRWGLMLKYFAFLVKKKRQTFANSDENFAWSPFGTLAALAMDNLYMDLWIHKYRQSSAFTTNIYTDMSVGGQVDALVDTHRKTSTTNTWM